MTLETARFGIVDYSPEDVVLFEDGLIGFPQAKRYLVLCPKPGSPFRWLQSVEEPSLAFLTTDPVHYVPDYAPTLDGRVARSLEIGDDTPRIVLTTANIPPGKPDAMTLNLAGPLLINAETRRARQVVLEDGAYTTKHRVFQQAERARGHAAA